MELNSLRIEWPPDDSMTHIFNNLLDSRVNGFLFKQFSFEAYGLE